VSPTEITNAGESVTQSPKEYVFLHADTNTVINLIDTPGLLDTSDVGTSSHETDKQHVDNILKLLSAYQEIHAIFILTKASVTRMSEAFQYTLTEIFKRLDKSACNNVVFILTNAASSNFKPDATQPILQRFLRENNLPIALPPEKPTIYCFENNIVKYLAECENKIPHNEDDEEDAQRSWRRSVKTIQELHSYIRSLEPHRLAVMMSINDATTMISMMSRLLVDTMMCMFRDVNELEKKKIQAEDMKRDIETDPTKYASCDLKKLLHIEETKIVTTALGYNNLVCESTKCADVEEGQVCCKKCEARHKYTCDIMRWKGTCKTCGCKTSYHTWSTMEKKIVKETVYRPNSTLIGHIVDSNDALKQINEGISTFEKRIKECEDEAQEMMEICAKLNVFVRQNASLGGSSTNDELLRYLFLQNQKQINAKSNDTSEADTLVKIKSRYEDHLKEAMACCYSVEDVPKLIQQLCYLSLKGKGIRRALDEYEKSKRQVVEEGKKSQKSFIVKKF